MNKLIYISILIGNCVLSAFCQVLLKKSSLITYTSVLKQYINPYVIVGYGLFFIVLFINVLLLRVLPLTLVTPVSEALPVALSLVMGRIVFGENVNLRRLLGVLIILCGIVVILG